VVVFGNQNAHVLNLLKRCQRPPSRFHSSNSATANQFESIQGRCPMPGT